MQWLIKKHYKNDDLYWVKEKLYVIEKSFA